MLKSHRKVCGGSFLLIAVAECSGGLTGVLAEESTEVGLVGEVETIGNLLDGQVGRLQQNFQFEQHDIVNHTLDRST